MKKKKVFREGSGFRLGVQGFRILRGSSCAVQGELYDQNSLVVRPVVQGGCLSAP